MFMLEKLVTSYGSDAKITKLVDKADWYIAPVLNPDGYVYSHTTVSDTYKINCDFMESVAGSWVAQESSTGRLCRYQLLCWCRFEPEF